MANIVQGVDETGAGVNIGRLLDGPRKALAIGDMTGRQLLEDAAWSLRKIVFCLSKLADLKPDDLEKVE